MKTEVTAKTYLLPGTEKRPGNDWEEDLVGLWPGKLYTRVKKVKEGLGACLGRPAPRPQARRGARRH